MTFYVQAKATKSIDAAIGEYFPGSGGRWGDLYQDTINEGRWGDLYQVTLVKGHQYEYLAGDACGCGCGGEAVLIAYINDGAPIALWVCGALFKPV